MSIDLTEAFDSLDSSEIVKIIVGWLNTQELIDFAEDDFSVHDEYNESHEEEEEEEEEYEEEEEEEDKKEKLTPWEKISQQEKRAYIMDYLENFPPDSLRTSFLAVLSSDDIEELAEKYFPDYLPDEDDIDDEDVDDEDVDDEDVEEDLMEEDEEEW